MQIAAGVPLVTVAARAGHARPSTTSDIYAHFIKSSDRSAAEVIDKVFNPELPQPEIKDLPVALGLPEPAKYTISNAPSFLSTDDSIDDSEADDGQDSIEYFRWAKAEMKRLGFESLAEFEEYQDYMERKKQQRTQRKNDYYM